MKKKGIIVEEEREESLQKWVKTMNGCRIRRGNRGMRRWRWRIAIEEDDDALEKRYTMVLENEEWL